jgi:MoaA/NifB/PqqE/SkfB family radical SAM enzyme
MSLQPNNVASRIHYFRNKLTGHINYPRVMEFELSNECNLECVMCNGYFSSSIRKNREKLPASVSPYNDQFVDELDQFIPHLTDAKFLGGEPFMIDIYLKIWERI